MEDHRETHADEQHDLSYEAPAVVPLGTVEAFTQGDSSSIDDG